MRELFWKHDRLIRCTVFALCVLASILVPVLHVHKYQSIREGVEFKFRCGGRDPYTPFLGRYLIVLLTPTQFQSPEPPPMDDGSSRPLYVKFRAGQDGFAEIVSCVWTKPDDMTGVWTFPAEKWYCRQNDNGCCYSWGNYPLDRYYLNEELALAADRLLISQSDIVAYVTLRNGQGVINRLTIQGEDAEVYLRKAAAEKHQ